VLHTVNKSPYTSNTLEECARFAVAGAPILLIEDGVYAAKSGAAFESKLAEIVKKNEVYALEADLKARGISNVAAGVKITNYDGFVELIEKHRMHAWV